MQGDGSRLATSGQQLPDILHVGLRLVFPWKLLKSARPRLLPVVVSIVSLRSIEKRAPHLRGKLNFSKAMSSLGQHKEAAFTVGHVTF